MPKASDYGKLTIPPFYGAEAPGLAAWAKRALDDIVNRLNGRLRFGALGNDERAGNFEGCVVEFRTPKLLGKFSVAHTLGEVPSGRLVVGQDGPGQLWDAPAWGSEKVWFESDTPDVTFRVLLLI